MLTKDSKDGKYFLHQMSGLSNQLFVDISKDPLYEGQDLVINVLKPKVCLRILSGSEHVETVISTNYISLQVYMKHAADIKSRIDTIRFGTYREQALLSAAHHFLSRKKRNK